jgi:hypothetical protein
VPFTLGVRPIDRLWLSLTVPYILTDGAADWGLSAGLALRF